MAHSIAREWFLTKSRISLPKFSNVSALIARVGRFISIESFRLLPQIVTFQSIKTLELGDLSSEITDPSPHQESPTKDEVACLAKLCSLRTLRIRTNHIDLSTLPCLSYVRNISITARTISESFMPHGKSAIRNLSIESFNPIHCRYFFRYVGSGIRHLRLRGSLRAVADQLGSFSNLVTLDLSESDIVNLSPIQTIKTLQRVSLYRTNVVNLTPVFTLPLLCELDISETQVDSLAGIEQCSKSLRSLNVSRSNLASLEPVRHLPQLRELILNEIWSFTVHQLPALTPLRHLSRLRRLEARMHLPSMTISTWRTRVRVLEAFRKLEWLALNAMGDRVSDLLALYSELKVLYLGWNFEKLDNVPFTTKHKKLLTLQLECVQFDQLSNLKNLPALEVLRLRDVVVRDYSSLIHLKNLIKLEITCALVHYDAPQKMPLDLLSIGRLTHLVWLDLSFTNIYNLEALCNLKLLEFINLSSTPIDDIEPLKTMIALQVVHLNDVENIDTTPLASLTKLRETMLSEHADCRPLRTKGLYFLRRILHPVYNCLTLEHHGPLSSCVQS